MSSSQEGSFSDRMRRPQASHAVPIPGADGDVDENFSDAATPSQWYASPGAGSYVAAEDSWRAVPPPMLASSLEPRFRPNLQPRADADARPQALSTRAAGASGPVPTDGALSYGSLDIVDGEAASIEANGAADIPVPAAVAQLERRERAARRAARRRAEDARALAPSGGIKAKMARVMVQVRQLNEAPRELWLIFAMKFLTSYAYFSLSIVLTIYLTQEFGMSDTAAGWAYGAYGFMSTFFGLLCGWFIDYLGVRASLLVGATVGAVSRLIMALTSSRHTAILMLYTLLPFAECLGIPIMTIGIKRYTNARNRTFAFSLFYSVMNLAALVAGPFVDLSRGMFKEGISMHVGFIDHDIRLSGLRVIVLSSSIATALMCFVVFIGIREIQVDEHGNTGAFTPNRESPLQETMKVLREPAFWRLTVFTFLLVGVRLVFRHIDATMPKYLTRQFGPDAPFGLVYAINPFLIILLVPTVGLLTRKVDSFSMILGGSFVSAASPFWLCIRQSYVSVVLFMVTLSIGEAVYSPRVYEYTMQVSAQGAEGLYSSLSSAPLFSVKLLVGGMSGWLLTKFMPIDGPQHGNILWGIVGLTSMTSPILMLILREYISPSDEDENGGPASQDDPLARKLTTREVLTSGSKPPTGRSAPIRIQSSDTDDVECMESDVEDSYGPGNGDEDALLPSSIHGNSPLSLPPVSNADFSPAGGQQPRTLPSRAGISR